jgi:hypothetical protein
MATAYIFLVVVLFYYLFAFNPKIDPYRPEDLPQQEVDRVNPFDQSIIRVMHLDFVSLSDDHKHMVEQIFNKAS